jgi:hypothetical protein
MAEAEIGKVQSDVLVSEYDPAYCRESILLTNPDADNEITFPVGTAVTLAGVPVLAAAHANTRGITLEAVTLAGGGSALVPVLARGPATVNKAGLNATDYAGDPITIANIVTQLAALSPPVIVRNEPTVQEEAD